MAITTDQQVLEYLELKRQADRFEADLERFNSERLEEGGVSIYLRSIGPKNVSDALDMIADELQARLDEANQRLEEMLA